MFIIRSIGARTRRCTSENRVRYTFYFKIIEYKKFYTQERWSFVLRQEDDRGSKSRIELNVNLDPNIPAVTIPYPKRRRKATNR